MIHHGVYSDSVIHQVSDWHLRKSFLFNFMIDKSILSYLWLDPHKQPVFSAFPEVVFSFSWPRDVNWSSVYSEFEH